MVLFSNSCEPCSFVNWADDLCIDNLFSQDCQVSWTKTDFCDLEESWKLFEQISDVSEFDQLTKELQGKSLSNNSIDTDLSPSSVLRDHDYLDSNTPEIIKEKRILVKKKPKTVSVLKKRLQPLALKVTLDDIEKTIKEISQKNKKSNNKKRTEKYFDKNKHNLKERSRRSGLKKDLYRMQLLIPDLNKEKSASKKEVLTCAQNYCLELETEFRLLEKIQTEQKEKHKDLMATLKLLL